MRNAGLLIPSLATALLAKWLVLVISAIRGAVVRLSRCATRISRPSGLRSRRAFTLVCT